MECRTARLLLDYVRPRSSEVEAGEVEALETHLAGCGECETLARAERRADEHLGRAVRDVPVPASLREQILARLGRERGARRRRVLARTARLAAAAAVLGLLAWLGYTIYPERLPEFNVVEVQHHKFLMMGANRERVQEWLDGQGKGLAAPPQFNYLHFSHHVMEERQGQQVPLLVFVHGKETAFVYVISGKHFDLGALFRDKPAGSGGQSVELLRGDNEHPHLAYVVIYTGESLRPFLTDSPTKCDCPTHQVAAWAVAGSGGEGLMSGMQGPRSGSRHGCRGGGIDRGHRWGRRFGPACRLPVVGP